MYRSGEDFLDKIYADMRNSEIVNHTALKSDKPEEKIRKYMDRLERVHKDVCKNNKLSLLKKYYYDKYVIKEKNIPESYFEHQEKIALDRGYGHVHYDERIKKEEVNSIINEQKASLDSWLDYFSSSDTNIYPIWFKYFCFQGMLKIGYFDKEKDRFTKRTSSTVKPFIELNREAIALIYDELLKLFNKEELTDIEMKKLLDGGGFSKIYAYAIKKIDSSKQLKLDSDEGIWKKYEQGSNPNILFNDIHGKGTGWCTAGGLKTAKMHIECGDFYVYFTKDENEEFTNPRIAIRTEDRKIAEIRGIAENQNLESNMEKVVEKKLEEFPDKDEYKKKVHDMELLTYIYTKWKNNIELTIDELKFLYEIDEHIIGFGYEKDPRIKEIVNTRNTRTDLAIIFNCNEDQISFTKEEALSGNIIFHMGRLYLSRLTSAEGLKLPNIINGNLELNGLTSAKGLILPSIINGNLELNRLTSAEGLKLPSTINGILDLSNLISAKDLILPNIINGLLNLRSLTNTEGLILPNTINGHLDLRSLTSAEGLVLPNKIGSLNLSGLTSIEGLALPNTINGSLDLRSLISAEGLKLPDIVNGFLDLMSLTSAEGLILPNTINGFLNLKSLISAKGLKLPNAINGSLNLSGLTSIEGLALPNTINGSLDLRSLISADDLILPSTINGMIYLHNLKSIDGITIPTELNCELDCPFANNDINVLKQMCKENNNQKQLIKNN